MPMYKKRRMGARKARGGRRYAGRRRGAAVALPKRITGDFASGCETFSVACTAGVVTDFTLNMTDLLRTKALMQVYQYYRITSVEMRFKPQTDTYAAGGAAQLPYLYFQYDKSGTLSGLNAQGFEAIGTKAIRLDDKTISRKWKPSVITDTGITGTTQFKVSPWLPTYVNAVLNDTVAHYGAIYYISKQTPSDATGYDVDVVVNVQFRKPNLGPVQGESNPNAPRIKQGFTTAIDLSLNPTLQG